MLVVDDDGIGECGVLRNQLLRDRRIDAPAGHFLRPSVLGIAVRQPGGGIVGPQHGGQVFDALVGTRQH